jgi:hypothetical protein
MEQTEKDQAPPVQRIAVIAVHGVADQKPGETAQALAELLVAQAPDEVLYRSAGQTDVILPVPGLDPMGAAAYDCARDGEGLSRGALLTDHLLSQARHNHLATTPYAARLVLLERLGGEHVRRCDVFEMYWADLSRLKGSAPEIVTELFTLLFRLSTLGRDAIASGAQFFGASKSWKLLARLQNGLDWAYSRVLALLFLQLIMIALTLVVLGLLRGHTGVAHKVIAVVFSAVIGLRILYRWRRFVPAVAAAGALGASMWCLPASCAIGLAWFVSLGWVYDAYLKMCEERFSSVRRVGWILWLGVLAATAGFAVTQPTAGLEMWIFGSLRAFEFVLVSIGVWWIAAGVVLVVWLAVGSLAGRVGKRGEGKPRKLAPGEEDPVDPVRRFQSKASVSTGRFGLAVSLAFFFVISMTTWALVNRGVAHAVDGFVEAPADVTEAAAAVPRFQYWPLIFKHPSIEFAHTQPQPFLAADFLDDRFNNSAEAFFMSFMVLTVLLVYLAAVLLPCILAELRWVHQEPTRLGCWLTGGYRRLETAIWAVVTAAVLSTAVVALALAWVLIAQDLPWAWLIDAERYVADKSHWLLEPLVLSTGAATVALTAAGRLLSRYVPWLRAPLDIALDVDNHFREFPREGIPRARIFSRYVALLRQIAAQNYDRIVIVSHSQGTVITADLLRYLKERAACETRGHEAAMKAAAAEHAPAASSLGPMPPDTVSALWEGLSGKLHLFTAGSPLRQLYATRFPVMYDWVLASHGGRMGPRAADIGVERWINAYGTGDYIGRWLWSRAPGADDAVLPGIDASHGPGHQAGDRYPPSTGTATSLAKQVAAATELDVSVGAEAHTHYFDPERDAIAWLVDALVATDPTPPNPNQESL